MQPKHTLLLALACGSYSVAAQQTETIDSVRIRQQQLAPVEVRAMRATQDAPFAKTEITAKDIEKQNLGQDIPYLLQYTPSAVATSDAGAGVGYTGLRVRGTDGQRINVTLNGIPVNDGESQGVFFVNTPDLASSTGSIQLQRGVGSSTNGGATFGATMSISNLQQMDEAGAEVSNSYGSFHTWKHTAKAGTGLLKNGLQFDVRLSKLSSNGYIERSSSDLKSLQFIAGWKASERTTARIMVMTGRERTAQAWNGVPQDSLHTNRQFNGLGLKSDGSYYDDQTDNYQQDYYQFFLDHKFSKNLTGHFATFLTCGKGYYQEYRLGNAFADYGLQDFIAGTDTITTTDLIRQLWLDNYFYGSVFSLMYEKNKTQLVLGGGWNQYLGDHYGDVKWAQYGVPADYRWYDLHSQKNDLNVYLKAQHKLTNKLTLFGDAQYRNVDYRIYGFRNNPTLRPAVKYGFFNPKVGLSYFVKNTARERQRLYASFAVANKEPNRDDFEAGATNIPRPERLNDIEAGYEVNSKKWSASANLYYMMYKDQLVLTGKINDVGAYARTNVASSYRRGLELQGAYVPAEWVKAFANATFSQNKIENFTEFQDDYDNATGEQIAIQHSETDISFSPNIIGAGGVTFAPFQRMKEGTSFECDVLG